MVNTARAELGWVASRVFGQRWPLDELAVLLRALLESYHGGGPPALDGSDFLKVPELDDTTMAEHLLRRVRLQTSRAVEFTAYYGARLPALGIEPAALTWSDVRGLPITHKAALRANPYDFVCRDVTPTFRGTTNGTTGRPVSVCFTTYELEASIMLSAIGNVMIGDILPHDIFLAAASARATLGNLVNGEVTRRIGALLIQSGQGDPAHTLDQLAEPHSIPGKSERVTFTLVYPSYLGDLVETGRTLGFHPGRFGLRRIDTGGEVVTSGLRRRMTDVFGDVAIFEGFGMTETWSMGGEVCEAGHFHYGANAGFWEFLDPETHQPAAPGEIATIVATPLAPSREATVLLRYDTGDLVRVLDETPSCSQAAMPAVSHPLGKRDLSVRHATGWTTPRDVLEALEGVDSVPLPARCGFWGAGDGVAVEVVVRGDPAASRPRLGDALEAHGVPLRELHVRQDRADLLHAHPFRGDLREVLVTPGLAQTLTRPADSGSTALFASASGG